MNSSKFRWFTVDAQVKKEKREKKERKKKEKRQKKERKKKVFLFGV